MAHNWNSIAAVMSAKISSLLFLALTTGPVIFMASLALVFATPVYPGAIVLAIISKILHIITPNMARLGTAVNTVEKSHRYSQDGHKFQNHYAFFDASGSSISKASGPAYTIWACTTLVPCIFFARYFVLEPALCRVYSYFFNGVKQRGNFSHHCAVSKGKNTHNRKGDTCNTTTTTTTADAAAAAAAAAYAAATATNSTAIAVLASKAASTSVRLIHYTSGFLACVTLAHRGKFWPNTATCFPPNPSHRSAEMDAYYVWELSFYLSGLLIDVVLEAHITKDSKVMLAHHIITIFCVAWSHLGSFHRIGVLVLMSHTACDVLLEAAKLLHYMSTLSSFGTNTSNSSSIIHHNCHHNSTTKTNRSNITSSSNSRGVGGGGSSSVSGGGKQQQVHYQLEAQSTGVFAALLVAWPVWRLWLFPTRILNVGATHVLIESSGRLEVGNTVCVSGLVVLLCLHVYWYHLIVRVALRKLKQGTLEDVRDETEMARLDNVAAANSKQQKQA